MLEVFSNLKPQSPELLKSWKATVRPSLPMRLRWPLLALVATLLAMFVYVAWQPFRSLRLQVVLLEPSSVAKPEIVNFDDVTGLLVRRTSLAARKVFERFEANANFVCPSQGMDLLSSLRAQQNPLNSARGGSPLIVCGSGILKPTNEGCIFCESLRQAEQAKGVNLAHLITQVADMREKPTLLLLEVYHDAYESVPAINASSILEQCKQEIASQLRSLPRSPLAVFVRLRPANAAPTTPLLAVEVVDALAESAGQLVSIESLQKALVRSADSSDWIVTPSWQNKSKICVAVPKTIVRDNAPELQHASEGSSSEKTPKLVSFNSTGKLSMADGSLAGAELQARIDEASAQQLLEYCLEKRDLWLEQSRAGKQVPNPVEHPQAWRQLDKHLLNCRLLLSYGADEPIRSELSTTALGMVIAERGDSAQSITSRTPAWANRFASVAKQLSPGDSIKLTSQDLERLNLLEQQLAVGAEERGTTELLRSWMEAPDPSTDLATLLEVATLKPVEWSLRRELIYAKLEELRCRSLNARLCLDLPAVRRAQESLNGSFWLSATRLQPQWQDKVRGNCARARRDFVAAQIFLQAVHRATITANEFMRHFEHWNNTIAATEDSPDHHDNLVVVMTDISHLGRLIQAGQVETSESIHVHTRNIDARIEKWLADINNELEFKRPAEDKVDVNAFVASTLVSNKFLMNLKQAASTGPPNWTNLTPIRTKLSRLRTAFALFEQFSESDLPHTIEHAMDELARCIESVPTVSELNHFQTELQLAIRSQLPQLAQQACGSNSTYFATAMNLSLLGALGYEELDLDSRKAAIACHSMRTAIHQQATATAKWIEHAPSLIDSIAAHDLKAWNQGLVQFGEAPIELKPANINVAFPQSLELLDETQRTFTLQLSNATQVVQDLTVTFDYSRNQVRLAQTSDMTTVQEIQASLGARQSQMLSLTLNRLLNEPILSPIVITLRGADYEEVQVLELDGGIPAFARIHLSNTNCSTTNGAGQIVAQGQECVLFANRENAIDVSVTNVSQAPLKLQLRVLALTQGDVYLPEGALNEGDSNSYLAEHSVKLLAESIATTNVDVNESRRIVLPPVAFNPAEPAVSFHSLVIQLVDQNSKHTQFIRWIPSIVRPSSMVSVSAAYDANRGELRAALQFHSHAPIPNSPVNIVARLLEPVSLRELGRGRLSLASQSGTRELKIPVLPRDGLDRRILTVDVDDWPNVFTCQFDPLVTQRSLAFTQDILGVALVPTGSQDERGVTILDHADTTLSAEVHTIVSEARNNPGEGLVVVGLDLNRDRFLASEPSHTLRAATLQKSMWGGIGPDGRWSIDCITEYPTVRLPLEKKLSNHIELTAHFGPEEQRSWSPARSVIVDHDPPSVVRVGLAEEHGVIGKPIEITIEVDDRGLSGIASVEGCWSLSGDSQFSVDAKPIAAVRRTDHTWSLKLPSEELRSGATLLLVRARDRSNNVSETFSGLVECYTPEEIAVQKKNITSIVQGRVLYGVQGLSSMDVAIESIGDEPPPQPLDSVQTNAGGDFMFPRVPSGKYIVRVSGLHRGTKIQRQTMIDVMAPTPPKSLHFRLDQPAPPPSK